MPAARPLKPPGMAWSSMLTQSFPPKPDFTENDLQDLSSKVYVVTGSNTGIGKELAKILFSKNAKVYIAARSEEKASRAIREIQNAFPQSKGELTFLHLDLSDLSTIKRSADEFTSREDKLHVLFNNAGVQSTKDATGNQKTAQGYEVHFGVNVLGTFLFTKLLTPTLIATARSQGHGTCRVVWVSSMGAEMLGEKSHGLTTNYLDYWPSLPALERYGLSKAGNWLHGAEFAKRHRVDGVISVSCNPGHLQTDLYRDAGKVLKTILSAVVLHPAKYGAYTELFAGLSPTITIEQTGAWVVPWGRVYPIRPDLMDATRSTAEGGNGHSREFWDWTEEQVKAFT
ncbi:hypothetical protein F5Y10DRAFT_284294 [Nemania abortiva]|nr:hypothetical protein F5Y10DRAFT_284294 [Nemania abortiva]